MKNSVSLLIIFSFIVFSLAFSPVANFSGDNTVFAWGYTPPEPAPEPPPPPPPPPPPEPPPPPPEITASSFSAPNATAVAQGVIDSGGSAFSAAVAAVVYLASPAAGGFSSTVIPIDGGTRGYLVICNNGGLVAIATPTSPPPPPGGQPPPTQTRDSPPHTTIDVPPPPGGAPPAPAAPAPGSQPAPAAPDLGGGFVPSPFNDLSLAVKPGNQTQYTPNSTANLTFTVTNNGSSAVNSAVGFWPVGGTGANPLSNCPTTSGNPVQSKNVSIGAGQSTDVTFSFNVGSTGATAYAYASYNCSPSENNWGNNIAGQTYTVNTSAWFESINGDVGSQGAITVAQTPPAGRYQSSYLLAGGNIDSKVQTQKWKVNNYTSLLVPSGGVYTYLAERFLQTAKTTGRAGCNISSGNASGFNYCSGDATFNAGGGPNGNSVWFIDGNLTIQKDLALAAGDTATFIVRGNVTANTSVKRVDGIYVAGATFNDADSSGNLGAQLVANGGVYAQNVNLSRKLGGTDCPSGVSCDNTQTPADQFVFDPKYLAGLNSILGTPSISWTETAP